MSNFHRESQIENTHPFTGRDSAVWSEHNWNDKASTVNTALEQSLKRSNETWPAQFWLVFVFVQT